MEDIKEILKSPINVTILTQMISKVTKQQYIIAELKRNTLQKIHYLTHIPNKNPFITEHFSEEKPLLLIRYKNQGFYLNLTKTLEVAEHLGDVSTWEKVE